MTACTSFLAFFAEQTLAFAVKMHSRPDRWPQIVRFASGRADSSANRRFVNDLKWQTADWRFAIWRSIKNRGSVRRVTVGAFGVAGFYGLQQRYARRVFIHIFAILRVVILAARVAIHINGRWRGFGAFFHAHHDAAGLRGDGFGHVAGQRRPIDFHSLCPCRRSARRQAPTVAPGNRWTQQRMPQRPGKPPRLFPKKHCAACAHGSHHASAKHPHIRSYNIAGYSHTLHTLYCTSNGENCKPINRHFSTKFAICAAVYPQSRGLRIFSL